MSAEIQAALLRHFELWELKAIGMVGIIGFGIGVGVTVYIRYTLMVQGIFKSMF